MDFEIISANYNNSKFLAGYFESILSSSVLPSSVIIVDDCSLDNSVEIINSYSSVLTIKLLQNTENIGFANSLNRAVEILKAPYFARLDPDDQVRTDRFSSQLEFLQKNPNIDIVGSNVSYILKGKVKRLSDVSCVEEDIDYQLRRGILPIIHGSIMGKSAGLKKFQYKQDCVPAEDYDLFSYFITNQFRIANIKDPLTLVTIHENSVSNDLKFRAIERRYDLANKYFGHNRGRLLLNIEFVHFWFYRRYLFESSVFKYVYLILAGFFMPQKALNRIFRKISVSTDDTLKTSRAIRKSCQQ